MSKSIDSLLASFRALPSSDKKAVTRLLDPTTRRTLMNRLTAPPMIAPDDGTTLSPWLSDLLSIVQGGPAEIGGRMTPAGAAALACAAGAAAATPSIPGRSLAEAVGSFIAPRRNKR